MYFHALPLSERENRLNTQEENRPLKHKQKKGHYIFFKQRVNGEKNSRRNPQGPRPCVRARARVEKCGSCIIDEEGRDVIYPSVCPCARLGVQPWITAAPPGPRAGGSRAQMPPELRVHVRASSRCRASAAATAASSPPTDTRRCARRHNTSSSQH